MDIVYNGTFFVLFLSFFFLQATSLVQLSIFMGSPPAPIPNHIYVPKTLYSYQVHIWILLKFALHLINDECLGPNEPVTGRVRLP